jgi:hypothetical protein
MTSMPWPRSGRMRLSSVIDGGSSMPIMIGIEGP